VIVGSVLAGVRNVAVVVVVVVAGAPKAAAQSGRVGPSVVRPARSRPVVVCRPPLPIAAVAGAEAGRWPRRDRFRPAARRTSRGRQAAHFGPWRVARSSIRSPTSQLACRWGSD